MLPLRRHLLILLMCWPVLGLAQELWVSAAISLKPTLEVMGRRFEAEHPGTRVIFNFAASGVLVQQMAQGAPADLLMTADDETLDRALQKGLVLATTRTVFATNRLVLITPAQAAPVVHTLQDLTLSQVRRVAVGNPQSVPAGRYAQQALAPFGLWAPLQPKLIWGESVRQVLTYVSRGEVDAGFVYASDVAQEKDKLRVVAEIDTPTPVRYPMARATASRQPALAEAFMGALRSPEAARELVRHGLLPP